MANQFIGSGSRNRTCPVQVNSLSRPPCSACQKTLHLFLEASGHLSSGDCTCKRKERVSRSISYVLPRDRLTPLRGTDLPTAFIVAMVTDAAETSHPDLR